MFPFSTSRSFLVNNYTDKVVFTEKLIYQLSTKFHHSTIATIKGGYEVTFTGGFTELLIRLRWISTGMLRITHSNSQIKVFYELSFVPMFWLTCFLSFMLICSIILNSFSIRVQNPMPQLQSIFLLWMVYTAIIYLTSTVFDMRIGKTINEVELSQENIPPEQQQWLSDKTLCPACGYSLQENRDFCPDCGLHLIR